MPDVETDLRAGIGLLEEVAECIVGCGCWQSDGTTPPWDDEARLTEAISRRDAAWVSSVRCALDRIAMLDDAQAESWSIWLGRTLDATAPYPPQDPRAFFARARAFLAAREET